MTPNEQFCKETGIKLGQLKTLKAYVNKAARAWIKHNNEGGRVSALLEQAFRNEMNLAHENADAYARKLGFEADWGPGLFPTLTKDGKEYHLPD